MGSRSLLAVWLVGVLTFCFGVLVGWTIKPTPPRSVIPESPVVSVREFRVERVLDGNSFEINYDGEPTVACIKGLEAPPMDQPEGQAAANDLAGAIAGKTVFLSFPQPGRKRDAQGRLIVAAHVGDQRVEDLTHQLARRRATTGIAGSASTTGATE